MMRLPDFSLKGLYSTCLSVKGATSERRGNRESTPEAIEADQVAGKPIDAEKHARLAGSLARLFDRLGLTARPGTQHWWQSGKVLREARMDLP
jgi:hypothetical protein